MPQDRFIHPKRGKLPQFVGLTDLEWRVHDAYLVAADNFGVMRCSSHTLKVADGGLSARPDRMLLRCVDALVDRGILVDFHDGDRRYVCQLDWQDDQKVKYPTRTYEPKPPEAVITRMTTKTKGLFGKWPGANNSRDRADQEEDTAEKISEKLSDGLENLSETFPETVHLVRSPVSWLTANGSSSSFLKKEGQREWFAAFYLAYPKKKGKQAAWHAWRKLNPDEPLRVQIAAAVELQRHTPEWTKEGGQFVPLPATWLNGQRWEDEVAIEVAHMSKLTTNLQAANAGFLAGGK